MINEIKSEVLYIFWLCVILAWGLMFCDIGNRQALWQDKYESWQYNDDCPVPDGFSRAMIDKEKL